MINEVSAISNASPYIPRMDLSDMSQLYGLGIAFNLAREGGGAESVSLMDYRPGSADNTGTGVGAGALDTAISLVMKNQADIQSTFEGMISPASLLSKKPMQ